MTISGFLRLNSQTFLSKTYFLGCKIKMGDKLPDLYFITKLEFNRLKPRSDKMLDEEGRRTMLMVPSVDNNFAEPFDVIRQEGDGFILRRSDMPGTYFGEGARSVALTYFTGRRVKPQLPDYLRPYGWA